MYMNRSIEYENCTPVEKGYLYHSVKIGRCICASALLPRSCLRNLLDRPRFHSKDKAHQSSSSGMAQEYLQMCRILIIGAGGLGCELMKDLALMGFKQIDIIDMDTIELSNLNRQFLFRHKDIGMSKAEVAAAVINRRVPGLQVQSHYCQIQDKDGDFYCQFHVVVAGLDSVPARRWINGMLISLLNYENGVLDESSVIPLIDGGTEGLKGNTRVILPGMSACIECTLELYPPQVTYPLCTIANTPRLPEHCIEFVKIIQWPKENPFGCSLDYDNPKHIDWIFEKSQERSKQFGIRGVDFRLVQGVVKNIIPAVASTNAVIAAACCTEVFKIVTGLFKPLVDSLVFNNADGIYTYSFNNEKKDDCIICSQVPVNLHMKCDACLEDMVAKLCLDGKAGYGMKNPALTAVIEGKQKTLYMSTIPSIERHTRENLKKTVQELGIQDGHEIVVTDETAPLSITFRVNYDK